jgi:hypothetical protein
MRDLVLTLKSVKLMALCHAQGIDGYEDLVRLSVADSMCPAICMTEGCDHIAPMESDQDEGHCEKCGGSTMVSALVLAGLI